MTASTEVWPGGTKQVSVPDESPQTKLVMFASPVRRASDSLDLTLKRLRRHNETVTRIVVEAIASIDGPRPGEISAYAQDGVLVAFDVEYIKLAMSCADGAMRALGDLASSGYEIACRIGLSVGEIVSVQYADGAPLDRVGRPVEIATRLVSDIAKPGQIVVDEQAHRACKRAGLESRLNLKPVDGEQLTIAGLSGSIPVFELVWDGTERKIRNRRQLLRELTAVQRATLKLRFALEGPRPYLANLKGDDERIRDMWSLIQELDPAKPRGILADLEGSWSAASEAQRNDALAADKRAILDGYARVRESWERNRPAMRYTNSEGDAAAREFTDEYERLVFAMHRFFDGVNLQLDDVEAMQ